MILWIKAFHIISIVCWFAVLFYLPRLFVYHAMSDDKISKDRFIIMERKLIRGIGNPSMIAVYIFGIALAGYNLDNYLSSLWFQLKIALVLVLTGYYHWCIRVWKNFRENKNTHSHVFYRWFNEIPVIFLIAIVCLVVIKPYW